MESSTKKESRVFTPFPEPAIDCQVKITKDELKAFGYDDDTPVALLSIDHRGLHSDGYHPIKMTIALSHEFFRKSSRSGIDYLYTPQMAEQHHKAPISFQIKHFVYATKEHEDAALAFLKRCYQQSAKARIAELQALTQQQQDLLEQVDDWQLQ